MSMKLGAASGTYNVQATESAKVTSRPSYKTVRCIVHFLDDAEATFEIDKRAKGQELLDKVFEHLELVEKDYFGLQFADVPQADGEDMRWLDATKALRKQIRIGPPYRFFFHVKFYVSDPSKLMEEYTRYHFFLQIKKDILDGKMVVPYKSAVLLASYAVQSELGDFCPDEHHDYYLSEFRFIPGQPESFEREVADMHKQHRGLYPADVELRYLDHVRRLDTYGVEMYSATVRDQNVLDVNLGVSAVGLVVFQNNIRINTFTWTNLVKISFKRKQFFVQLRRQANESIENLIGFDMVSYRACKNLWKSCIEHHTFFRLHAPPLVKNSLFSLGSKFRYSGRTEYQAIEDSKKRAITGRTFVRSPSKRFARRTVGSAARDAILREMPHSNTMGDFRYADNSLRRQSNIPNSTSYPLNMRNYANNNIPQPQQQQQQQQFYSMNRSSLPPDQRISGGLGVSRVQNGWTANGGTRWQQQDRVPDNLTYATIAGDTVTRRSRIAGETRIEQQNQNQQQQPQLQQRNSRMYESNQEMRAAPRATMEDLVYMASRPSRNNDSDASYRDRIAKETKRLSTAIADNKSNSISTSSLPLERVANFSGGSEPRLTTMPTERIPTIMLNSEPRSATMMPALPPKTSTGHDHHNGGYNGNNYYNEPMPNGHAFENHGLVTIRMKPDIQGRFGFNVKGGADQNMPIIVSRVAPGTPADLCYPRLNEGDQVLFINGRDISQHTHEQVVQFIRSSRELHTGELVLIVRPNVYIGDDLPSEPEFQYIPDASQVSANLPAGHDPLVGSMMVLRESLESGAALAQFEQLFRKRHDMTNNAALTNENMAKNRYRDILPYDETRVRLRNAPSGDYINASYVNMEVPGMGIINRYIAAQGPLPNTTSDFWLMVWQQQCTLVVMLTTQVERGRVKCHQYWPNLYETLSVSDSLRLTCTKEEQNGVFAFREFTLVNREDIGVERHIYQMQYIAWPDHGVPDDSREFIDFVSRVRQNRIGMVEPTVVHCSAGIGRTGVLITMETAMCLIEANEPVYPLTIVRQMRDQRAMLIQTSGQYKFVCEAILRAYSDGIVKPLEEYKKR